MPDGCWRVRLLWEQEGWVPVGGVMGEGGGGGQAVSAIGSDGKGWSRGGAQTPNPRLCDSGISGCLLSGPALCSSFLPWSSPPPLFTSFSSPWPLFQAPMSPTPSVSWGTSRAGCEPCWPHPQLPGRGRPPKSRSRESKSRTWLGTQRPGAAWGEGPPTLGGNQCGDRPHWNTSKSGFHFEGPVGALASALWPWC